METPPTEHSRSAGQRRSIALASVAVAAALAGVATGILTNNGGGSVSTTADRSTTAPPASRPPSTSSSTSAVTTSAAPTTVIPTTVSSTGPPSTVGSTTTPPVVSAAKPPERLRSLNGATIVVDPGHNGANGSHPKEINRLVDAGGSMKACNTTGTAEGSYSEAEFNFAVALQLKADLEARGAKVVMTRNDNNGVGPCIDERGQVAAKNNADLLISIHADGNDTRSNHGFHVIYPLPLKGYTADTAASSAALATAVRDAVVAGGFKPSNYIGSGGLDPRRDLGTLNRAPVPAVMIESGNMHSPDDLTLLKSADGQARLATALADGVANFLASR